MIVKLHLALGSLLFLSFFITTQTAVSDETITADLVHVSTPQYHSQPDNHPALGKYSYVVSWEGIPAAEADLEVSKGNGLFNIVATAKTNDVIDILYRLRYRAEGLLSQDNLSPVKTSIHQKENSKEAFTEISYLPSGEVRSYRRKDGKEPQVLQFNPNNPMLEPFSAALLAASLDWSAGESREFDVFNGKSRYLITFTATEKVREPLNGEMRDMWVISPKVTNLTENKPTKKLREASIYVTADENRQVAKIVSSVFIGSVSTELQSFTPASDAGSSQMMARSNDDIFLK